MGKAIHYQSTTQLISSLRQRKISAVEVMQAYLDRIEKINPLLNAIIQKFSIEECLKQAQRADEQTSRGIPLGKLHGLPFTVKDTHFVKGLTSCMGSLGLKNIALEDSSVVSRLKNEGAIVIGLTNVPEFLAAYETDNLVYGRTNNPYDLSKTPGGSSGGCAASVAAGLSPFSIGSDAAGSIRWPAHCTGIAAHKPTIGLVPRTGSPLGNAKGLIAQFATPGVLARSVEDLMLVLPIIAGPDEIDPHVAPVTIHDPNGVNIKNLRIAYFIEDGLSKPSLETVDFILNTIKELSSLVKSSDEIEIDSLNDAHTLLWESYYLGGDKGEAMKSLLSKFEAPISPLMKSFLLEAKKSSLSVTQYKNLFREMDLFRMKMLKAMEQYDVLLSPVAATPAKEHGTTLAQTKDFNPCMVHSLTGWPVTVVRCGTTKEGLPIGLQIAAKPWNDHIALALAKTIEELTGGWQPPTNLHLFKM